MRHLLTALLVLALAAAAVFAVTRLDSSGEFSFALPRVGPEIIEVEYPSVANPNHQDFVSRSGNLGRIYIGDSRFLGMNTAVHLLDEEDQFLVAETGKGYSWLVNTALGEVDNIRSAYADDFDTWQYIICLGINDLGDVEKYLETYYSLAQDASVEVVLVSVGPVGSYPGVTNAQVEAFNARLQDSPFHYIDTYTVLMNEGFYAGDGLHYDNETYQRIYNTILDNL